MAGLRELEMLGANVTVPHKEAVGGLLDRIDSSARTVGAVNVIAREDRMLVGYNTDVRGPYRRACSVSGRRAERPARQCPGRRPADG